MFIVKVNSFKPYTSDIFQVPYTTFTGGEIKLRLPPECIETMTAVAEIEVFARLNNSADIMALAMLRDAIYRCRYDARVSLFVPYMPYGRQDRVCSAGEAFSSSVMARFINTLNFNAVHTIDPHNAELFSDLFEHSDIVAQWYPLYKACAAGVTMGNIGDHIAEARTTFDQAIFSHPIHEYVVVAPDKGARGKAQWVSKMFTIPVCVFAEKVRNPETMEIESITLQHNASSAPVNLAGKHLLVADDICDGGRTFIELAKELKKFSPASLTLYVTHAIFSYGTDTLKEHYDTIIHTDSIRPADTYKDTTCIPYFETVANSTVSSMF